MPHIVQCLTHSHWGGGQHVVFTLVQRLSLLDSSIDTTVILPSGGIYNERFRSLGVNVVNASTDRLSIQNVFRMRLLLQKLRPDVIHSHGKGAGFYTRMISLQDPSSVRQFHSYHGFHPPSSSMRRWMYDRLESFLIKLGGRTVSVSPSEAAEVGERYEIPSEQIIVLPNVVDREEVKRQSAADLPYDVGEFLRHHSNSLKVAMIGRPDPVKNHALAYKAIELLRSSQTKIAFVFAGISSDDAQYRRLIQYTQSDVLAIPFLESTASLLGQCDVLLMPSKKEGCPLAILETFALGKPVIGTDVSGIRDLVHHRKNGLLCRESADSIADALRLFQSDRSLQKQLADGAEESGRRMNVENWARCYRELYLGAAKS